MTLRLYKMPRKMKKFYRKDEPRETSRTRRYDYRFDRYYRLLLRAEINSL